ncbi:hypothetical protein ANCCEY_08134 [Ancylostoma ceylanicum]|nr:hypothetical protein ANCCEY_08134 [Ancylostoma ceylanicum]
MPKANPQVKRAKERKKHSGKKSKKSKTSKKDGKSQKKLKKIPKRSKSSKKSEKRGKSKKGKDRHRKDSGDTKKRHKKSKDRKDKHRKKRSKSKTPSPHGKKGAPPDKHWIEEEFLQPYEGKPQKPSPKEMKKPADDLPLMETQQATGASEGRKKKKPTEGVVVISERPLPPPIPSPVPKEVEQPPPKPVEKLREKPQIDRLKDKIYGIQPEKPAPPELATARLKLPSPPVQQTQDEMSPMKAKIPSPGVIPIRASPPKDKSVTISVSGLPIPTKQVPSGRLEVQEAPAPAAVGERLRVNIDEILRLGGIMERRGMSTSKKMSFEWIALNRHIVNQQPEAFSSHLISAVGDVRLEKSLACDALNVLMYQHTVSPDEYLRLCQHLDNVQPITIGILAQLLRANTQYYSSVHNLRSQSLQLDPFR